MSTQVQKNVITVTAPAAIVGQAIIFVDTSDGDLKVIFGDGVVKTLATDT